MREKNKTDKVNIHEQFATKYIRGIGIMPRHDIKYLI